MPISDPRRMLPAGGPRTPVQMTAGVAAVRRAPLPDAEMVTQALHGEVAYLTEERGGFGLIQLQSDGYVGWVDLEAISSPVLTVTHRVNVLRTYVFAEPDLKSAPRFLVSMNAGLVAEAVEGRFTRCARAGWVTSDHIAPLGTVSTDPVEVALQFVGTPYLWGGKESLGLDCTGLTQTAFAACGIDLPRDSDMQFAEVGSPIADWQAPGALKRGDLVFWRGHVGLMANDRDLIHANAHHMAVAREPLDEAIIRIAAYYDHPIGARRVLAEAHSRSIEI